MERLLHYVWKYKLYSPATLVTTEGAAVSVIDAGIQNTDAGPDFFNAKIKIGDTLWAGSVEIHDRASDWLRHRHDKDKAYDSVILHVTAVHDATVYRTNGEVIPQALLPVPETVKRNIDWLIRRDAPIPCLPRIKEIEPIQLSSWLNALLSERLERKTKDIMLLLEQYNDDWNEVFYIVLTRSFGFGVNNDAFERLAKSLPFRFIQKQRGSSSQIESMLFGQAGMLEETSDCHYYRLLQQEYKFLRHKFKLSPLDESLFKNLRMRPHSFPHVKLAQLASFWYRYDSLFPAIRDEKSPEQIKKLFRIPPSDYWKTHYHFRHVSPAQEKLLGENALNILLINVVAPMLFAYGGKQNLPEYSEWAIRFLENIPPEKNMIVSSFCNAGIPAGHAGDSQALIQLKREYCEKKKCLYCRIGFRLLKRSHP
ncbi:MAG: DUF2851 family protein [Tannerellaceae bacterium]|jgi:hypothetical protein|nr:DUF2851 family protein [Tannerellaceae bacterium]